MARCGKGASGIARVKGVDVKLEVVVIPVSDVDRAKNFSVRHGIRCPLLGGRFGR